MGRAPCCDKVGLKKGPWSPEEDQILISFIQNHGHSNWRALPKQAGLLRCGKSCRLRWINYLRPDIKRGNFTKEEEDTIIQLHEMMGNRWSAIAARLPGRTDNEIKNVWHTYLKKRLQQNETTKSQSKATPKHSQAKDVTNILYTSANNSDYAPSSSQQSYTSDGLSSITEVSSLGVSNNLVFGEDEHIFYSQLSNSENYSIIDETFWSSQDNSLENDGDMPLVLENIIDDSQLQFSYPEDNDTYENTCHKLSSIHDVKCPGNYEDNMDFWFDIFVKAGGATELPE